MKKFMIIVAVICLCSSAAYAADYCDTKYGDMVNKLEKSTKIMDDMKAKYLTSLNKAYQLCKQDKMEEARKIMDELKDQFLQDALYNQRAFFGN